jgi:hypothetical protein
MTRFNRKLSFRRSPDVPLRGTKRKGPPLSAIAFPRVKGSLSFTRLPAQPSEYQPWEQRNGSIDPQSAYNRNARFR